MLPRAPLPLPSRALLFSHLAAMEKAGVPAERAYALLDLGSEARPRVADFRKLAARGIDPASAGMRSGLFTLFETQLLRAAIAAGGVEHAYQRLAESHATRVAQRRTVRARLMLPLTILVLALLVQPLPALFAGRLSGAGYLWQAARPLLLMAALAALGARLAVWFASGTPSVWRAPLASALLALPLFGPLHLRRNTRDFVDSLALLLQAGMPLIDAMPVALATVGNHLVRADLAAMLPALQAGSPFADAVAALRLVDGVTLHAFAQTGEQSGTLPEMLQRHARADSAHIEATERALVDWLPRVLYALVACWMAAQLLGAPSTLPPME